MNSQIITTTMTLIVIIVTLAHGSDGGPQSFAVPGPIALDCFSSADAKTRADAPENYTSFGVSSVMSSACRNTQHLQRMRLSSMWRSPEACQAYPSQGSRWTHGAGAQGPECPSHLQSPWDPKPLNPETPRTLSPNTLNANSPNPKP